MPAVTMPVASIKCPPMKWFGPVRDWNVQFDKSERDILNPKGLNLIWVFPVRGSGYGEQELQAAMERGKMSMCTDFLYL